MAGTSEELARLFAPPESLDPTDADNLGDETVARKKSRFKSKASADIAQPESGRLRLRPGVPVLEKYKGKKIDRREVFDEETRKEVQGGVPEVDDLDDLTGGGSDILASSAAGGLGISGGLEGEYERMMRESRKELEVMRVPSAAESRKREEEAAHLKRQFETWNTLVELRIHLESALALGHRLPAGRGEAALRASDPAVATEAGATSAGVRGLLSVLLESQRTLAEERGVPRTLQKPRAGGSEAEADAWARVDSRLQRVLDWELGVADDWKGRTQLDVRRSFKVLDQSLTTQMQVVSESEPAKLRKRCTPPPDRHSVFGSSVCAARAGAGEKPAGGAAGSQQGAEGADGSGSTTVEGPEQDIFDDREFYVQLLREVLADGGKTGDGLTRNETKNLQAELQGRHGSKKRARPQVDPRASKGRKIRYVAIEKLQNFMAPRPRSGTQAADGSGLAAGAADPLLRALFAVPRGA